MKKPRECFVPLAPPEEAASRLAAFQQKIKQLEAEIQQTEKAGATAKLSQLREALWQLRRRGSPDDLPAAYAVAEGKPVNMYVHVRGDVNQHGPVVPRNVPKVLAGHRPLHSPAGTSGRLQLAQGLPHPHH